MGRALQTVQVLFPKAAPSLSKPPGALGLPALWLLPVFHLPLKVSWGVGVGGILLVLALALLSSHYTLCLGLSSATTYHPGPTPPESVLWPRPLSSMPDSRVQPIADQFLLDPLQAPQIQHTPNWTHYPPHTPLPLPFHAWSWGITPPSQESDLTLSSALHI